MNAAKIVGEKPVGADQFTRRGNACAALSDADFRELERIANFELTSGSLLISATTKVGELATAALPDKFIKVLESVITPVLMTANGLAAGSHVDVDDETWIGWLGSNLSGEWFHKAAAAVSGALGGSAGLPTAVIEVGASTTLILRSIQSIARGYGQDLSDPVALAECVAVLGRGGPSKDDDEVDVAYWAMRAGLKKAVTSKVILEAAKSDLVQNIAAKAAAASILESAAFKQILARYGVTSLQIFAEKSVPFVGAALGAFTNYQFISYYQSMAHVVYRLKPIEEKYEYGDVSACYQRILRSMKKANSIRPERHDSSSKKQNAT